MIHDAVLKGLVSQFAASPNPGPELAEQILLRWTGADAYAPNSRGAMRDGRHLYALEALMGEQYIQLQFNSPDPWSTPANDLEAIYGTLFAYFQSQLLAQAQVSGIFSNIVVSTDPVTQAPYGDLTAAADALNQAIAADRNAGLVALNQFVTVLKGLDKVDSVNAAAFRAALAQQGPEATAIIDAAWRGKIVTDLDDTVTGASGNDTIDGFGGNDALTCGLGDDTYLFNAGSGQDIIGESGGADTIRFGAGVTPADVRVRRDASSLYLDYGTSDRIKVASWLSGAAYQIERVEFSDDTAWDKADDRRWSKAV